MILSLAPCLFNPFLPALPHPQRSTHTAQILNNSNIIHKYAPLSCISPSTIHQFTLPRKHLFASSLKAYSSRLNTTYLGMHPNLPFNQLRQVNPIYRKDSSRNAKGLYLRTFHLWESLLLARAKCESRGPIYPECVCLKRDGDALDACFWLSEGRLEV